MASEDVSLECIVVLNGLSAHQYHVAEVSLQQQFAGLRLVHASQPGLTQALIKGCSLARGWAIARLDVGDVMTPDRLLRQARVLEQSPDCVLVTSDMAVCGPCWELMRVKHRPSPMLQPQRADTLPPQDGLAIDIPHHASVLLRRSAYNAVGGYRSEFYYGQDWDLWYRLAEQGTFFHIPEVLTKVRLFPQGLSSCHWREQQAIAALSRACFVARRRGQTEELFLKQAAHLRPLPQAVQRWHWFPFDRHQAEGAYFIAESLRRNSDSRCRRYFAEALRYAPWLPKVWLRAAQSLHLSPQP